MSCDVRAIVIWCYKAALFIMVGVDLEVPLENMQGPRGTGPHSRDGTHEHVIAWPGRDVKFGLSSASVPA